MLGGPEGTRPWDDEAFRGALWLDDFADDMPREPLLSPRGADAKRFSGDLKRFLAAPAAPAKAPAASTTAELARERVVLSMGHRLLWMDEPRGTVRETKGPRLAVELDAGPTGWVAKRKTTPSTQADLYERLRTNADHWTPLLELGPDALVRKLKPFLPETDVSFGPHEIRLGAPHLCGATRSLSDDLVAEVLLRLAEILLDDFTPNTRVTPAHQKRFRLMGVLLSALQLRVLHTGLSHERAGLRETWPASRVKRLRALGTKCAASSWLPRIQRTVSLIDEVPDAPELFLGEAWKTPVVPSPRARTDAQTWLDLDEHGS